MDPNEALRKLRYMVVRTLAGPEEPEALNDDELAEWWQGQADGLAQQFDALDSWLSRGGFPPEEWREGPDAAGEEEPASECGVMSLGYS